MAQGSRLEAQGEAILNALTVDVAGVKTDVAGLKTDVADLKVRMQRIEERPDLGGGQRRRAARGATRRCPSPRSSTSAGSTCGSRAAGSR